MILEDVILKYESHSQGELTEHEVSAYYQGRLIGQLPWDETGKIGVVAVGRKFRRQGVATKMWNHAQTFDVPPQHSPNRTSSGNAWAHAVGGYVPNLKEDPTIDIVEWVYDTDYLD